MRSLVHVAREAESSAARVQAIPRLQLTPGATPEELMSEIKDFNRQVDGRASHQPLRLSSAGLGSAGMLTGDAREFRSHTAHGQLGHYHADQTSAGTNAALLSLQGRARALAPADRCHYWNCKCSMNIRRGGSWVCPLCVCHVFCTSACGYRAGHPGQSIQCAPHRGWIEE